MRISAPSLRVGMLAILTLTAVIQIPVGAQAQGMGAKRGRSLQLAGIIEPVSCDAAPCLGVLKLQIDRTVRRLGVTMAQTENEQGMDIFRSFTIQSGQPLRLLGPKPLVQPFLDAPPGTAVKMWGMFEGLNLILGDLTVEQNTPAPTP